MGIVKEFKDFAMRGNLVDIAVAFVMGASFGKIVTSFIDGIVMPLIGMITGGVNFTDKVLVLKEGAPGTKEAAVVIKYGVFITNVFDFMVVSFSVFLVIKAINQMKRKDKLEEPAAEASNADKLLAEIRDALKKTE